MRHALTIALVLASLSCGGCASVEYSDNYDTVRRNPECVTQSPQPGEPVAPWCTPEAAATWSSDSEGAPVEFKRDDDDR
ncbi:MAG TPA: hypothetical protein VFK18_02900 [Luteimonas sp.]|nr:hypothetical protein [Luteimonas sp.]